MEDGAGLSAYVCGSDLGHDPWWAGAGGHVPTSKVNLKRISGDIPQQNEKERKLIKKKKARPSLSWKVQERESVGV